MGWSAGSDGYWSQYYDEGAKGQLTVRSLPPGKYEFFGFSVLTGAWGGLRTVRPTAPFSVAFKVAAGETVYLGGLTARFVPTAPASGVRQGQVQIDPQRRLTFVMDTVDTSARDLPELVRRSPELSAQRVTVRLLR